MLVVNKGGKTTRLLVMVDHCLTFFHIRIIVMSSKFNFEPMIKKIVVGYMDSIEFYLA